MKFILCLTFLTDPVLDVIISLHVQYVLSFLPSNKVVLAKLAGNLHDCLTLRLVLMLLCGQI